MITSLENCTNILAEIDLNIPGILIKSKAEYELSSAFLVGFFSFCG
ncbi:hypothetical protein GCM10008935_26620 [Alkalibacillus silvisoli]|uniref:Uncharacterized protein n=1 Tax=Alkalibacillus silvisoli TaxID=392823 RepID=A0ABN1A7H7_9BACI